MNRTTFDADGNRNRLALNCSETASCGWGRRFGSSTKQQSKSKVHELSSEHHPGCQPMFPNVSTLHLICWFALGVIIVTK